MASTSVGPSAVTVALRGMARMSAISPKFSPGVRWRSTEPPRVTPTVPESTTNTSTDTTTKPAETTTKKAKEDSGSAYTVNQALDALTNYYGKGYDVDGTVSEGNNYYFAVYKNKKKYASVKVNMQTGDAVETRTKDGATANFNVFV